MGEQQEKLRRLQQLHQMQQQRAGAGAGGGGAQGGSGGAQAIQNQGSGGPGSGAGSGSGSGDENEKQQQRIVERVSDGRTFELQQGPKEADLTLFIPYETKAKTVKCVFLPSEIAVNIGGKTYWKRQLTGSATITPSECTWTVQKKDGLHEAGDPVTLKGLSTASLNGTNGKVVKASAETAKAGRIAVVLDTPEGKLLSVKPDNLVNHNGRKKASISLSLQKAVERAVWQMPPWEDLSSPLDCSDNASAGKPNSKSGLKSGQPSSGTSSVGAGAASSASSGSGNEPEAKANTEGGG